MSRHLFAALLLHAAADSSFQAGHGLLKALARRTTPTARASACSTRTSARPTAATPLPAVLVSAAVVLARAPGMGTSLLAALLVAFTLIVNLSRGDPNRLVGGHLPDRAPPSPLLGRADRPRGIAQAVVEADMRGGSSGKAVRRDRS